MNVSLEVYVHWPGDEEATRIAWPEGCRVPTVGEQMFDHTAGRSGTVTTVDWNLQRTGEEHITYLWAVLIGVE